jgi:hypothetical protein
MIVLVESGDPLNRFIRFGKLDSYQIQNVHIGNYLKKGKEPSIHLAPENRGFYAFPMKFADLYLIGCLDKTQKDTFPKREPPSANEIQTGGYSDEEKAAIIKAGNDYANHIKHIKNDLIRHSFALKNDDLLWHHFDDLVPVNEIERRSGDWVLTSVASFKKALHKSVAIISTKQGGYEQRSSYLGTNYLGFGKTAFEVFIPPGTLK